MESKKILVVGSLNMDLVTRVKTTPRIGETVQGNGLKQIPGGKGANQATAMVKLGAKVSMAGRVGRDAYGEILKSKLHALKVEDHVSISNTAPTGTALIMVNETADNSIVVIPGANGELSISHLDNEVFDAVDFLVMQLEVPVETVREALEIARAKGIITILNPAPAIELPADFFKDIDFLVLNETEFETYTAIKFKDKNDLVAGFKQLGSKAIILTLGSEGSWYYNGSDSCHVPALSVEAVDTTAAGDSYIGGLLFELSTGKSIEEAMLFATKVAAYTVTKFGAQSSLPTYENMIEGGYL